MVDVTALLDMIDSIRVRGFAAWHFLLVGTLIYRASSLLREAKPFVRRHHDDLTREDVDATWDSAWARFILGVAFGIWLLFGSTTAKIVVTVFVIRGEYDDARAYAAGFASGLMARAGKSLDERSPQALGRFIGAARFTIMAGPLITLTWFLRHGV